MRTKPGIIIPLIIIAVCFVQCNKKDQASGNIGTAAIPGPSPSLPAATLNYNIIFPAHIAAVLPATDNTPANNVITNDGATLGRVLFYDKHLSKNNTISCSSCHSMNTGFSDRAQFSRGFEGGFTPRASMQLLNLRFYRSGKMFWDERANTLEDQVLQPIQNHVEMGLTLTELVQNVSAQTYYPALFQKAFGTTEITTDRISKALSQFLRSIVTYQSKYDRVKQGIETFTADEAAGEQVFLTAGGVSCAGCHTPPMFITSTPQAPFALPDANDLGINNQRRFKSGSLRNIAQTAPYFHNGSVATLDAVIGSGIQAHTVPAPDRQRLIAFLNTLTDNTVNTDIRFSDPFK